MNTNQEKPATAELKIITFCEVLIMFLSFWHLSLRPSMPNITKLIIMVRLIHLTLKTVLCIKTFTGHWLVDKKKSFFTLLRQPSYTVFGLLFLQHQPLMGNRHLLRFINIKTLCLWVDTELFRINHCPPQKLRSLYPEFQSCHHCPHSDIAST